MVPLQSNEFMSCICPIGSKVILAGAKMETSLPQIPLQNAATHGQSKLKQIN